MPSCNAQLGFVFKVVVMPKELNSVKIAFEPFGKIEPGKPIKILPLGMWYRGKRILDITKDRAQEIVNNFKSGLPRFRVGFNLDHAENSGKVGDVKELAVLDDGLYATEYELTEKGRKAIEEDGYDATSAELIWSLNNGAKYQDPETGTEHDNVLVGVAFTPKPFFGHSQTALYTADIERADCVIEEYRPFGGAASFEEYDAWREAQKIADNVRETTYLLRELIDNVLDRSDIKDKAGAIADLASEYQTRIEAGEDEMSEKGIARSILDKITSLGKSVQTENAEDYEEVNMPEEIVEIVEEEVVVEEAAETIDVEKLAADLGEANERTEKLSAELASLRMDQRKDRIHGVVESFKALPVEVEEFTDKMLALEDVAPEIAKWVEEKLAAFDKVLEEAGLMKEIGSEHDADISQPDRFLAMVESKVKEGVGYADAMKSVAEAEPKLAAAYYNK